MIIVWAQSPMADPGFSRRGSQTRQQGECLHEVIVERSKASLSIGCDWKLMATNERRLSTYGYLAPSLA